MALQDAAPTKRARSTFRLRAAVLAERSAFNAHSCDDQWTGRDVA